MFEPYLDCTFDLLESLSVLGCSRLIQSWKLQCPWYLVYSNEVEPRNLYIPTSFSLLPEGEAELVTPPTSHAVLYIPTQLGKACRPALMGYKIT